MSWNLLERFIDSEHFNKDPSLTVAYLARYADHVGIHYVLCSKLRQFSYEEIEFFLPQICHLLVSINNESMALEEFVIDLCEESVSGALLTFWLFQTYLHDLSSQPASQAFQTCRRIYNKVQRIVFGGAEPRRRDRIRENVLPVTVLSSLVLASVGVPLLASHVGPLAVAQSRRPRPVDDGLFEASSPAQRITRSNTVTGSSSMSERRLEGTSAFKDAVSKRPRKPTPNGIGAVPQSNDTSVVPQSGDAKKHTHRHSTAMMARSEALLSSSSLPEKWNKSPPIKSAPGTPGGLRGPSDLKRQQSGPLKTATSNLSRGQKVRMLRQNYFRSELQFLSALEGISSRLVAVPKPARLSALRAELALIAQDLPAEVDIPMICAPTLIDGLPRQSRHHRIVRLNPAEATSLNSAEKVPYLLMLEVLIEDFDFDPDTQQNQQLLSQLVLEKGKPKRRLFDTTDAARETTLQSPEEGANVDSVLEPLTGDLSSASLLQGPDSEKKRSPASGTLSRQYHGPFRDPPRLSLGMSTLSTASIPTPPVSDGPISRASSPGPRPSPYMRPQIQNQAEVSALADHMRTASQMLAQLEVSAGKRPRNEVAAIKAKIIASMQSLEEQSFLAEENLQGPSFDTIMARANEEGSHAAPHDLEEDDLDAPADPKLNSGRGADRMENDEKTGGIVRKGDRDDPSAATFGEAWEQKKERIRRSSPYGWASNWDLVSVIVKTGADLRQEAFACQLIAVCSKIWAEHSVDVWVKNMRILVTGESSGLIETITNAVSLHSLKRSLTLAFTTSGENPRKRFATLQDHFIKAFGPTDSPAYAKATACFAQSLAAYSIISYVLQLKDRHNGNILIDSDGHCIHIDFGFMLSNSPGNMGFEAAPFKLTMEYVELLGGIEGAAFLRFKELMKDSFQALRREAERILTLVELMGRASNMAAYGGGGVTHVVAALRARFVLEKSREEAREWVEELVTKSLGSYYTRLYDTFQYRTQGIY